MRSHCLRGQDSAFTSCPSGVPPRPVPRIPVHRLCLVSLRCRRLCTPPGCAPGPSSSAWRRPAGPGCSLAGRPSRCRSVVKGLTAAIPMENPNCSCKPSRCRCSQQLAQPHSTPRVWPAAISADGAGQPAAVSSVVMVGCRCSSPRTRSTRRRAGSSPGCPRATCPRVTAYSCSPYG